VRRLLLFCAFVLVAVFPARNYAQNNGLPLTGGELVFTGVAGRFSNRNDSIQAALRDAARRLSFFYSVKGETLVQEHIGAGVFDYSREVERSLSYDEDLEKHLEKFQFDPSRDVFESNNAVFVVARVSAGQPMPSPAGHSAGRERPAWVDSPPGTIGGFIVGVGFAGRRSFHKDTVIASYENAVFELIENINTTVNDQREIYQNSYSIFDFDMSSSSTVVSRAALKNFYIIESWTDPANLSVWTLAVAEKDNEEVIVVTEEDTKGE
jgi:hypothetical protein